MLSEQKEHSTESSEEKQVIKKVITNHRVLWKKGWWEPVMGDDHGWGGQGRCLQEKTLKHMADKWPPKHRTEEKSIHHKILGLKGTLLQGGYLYDLEMKEEQRLSGTCQSTQINHCQTWTRFWILSRSDWKNTISLENPTWSWQVTCLHSSPRLIFSSLFTLKTVWRSQVYQGFVINTGRLIRSPGTRLSGPHAWFHPILEWLDPVKKRLEPIWPTQIEVTPLMDSHDKKDKKPSIWHCIWKRFLRCSFWEKQVVISTF